ncbi:hypothetical protein ACPWT1_11730 [Ramlibacter sp. MMS24-I3-19]|uniref:hypothetical protein n=1 Tax=Ramlibacter sp. MMS24-I3-19 TaxID=3416606 RepID=UPI003CFE53CF
MASVPAVRTGASFTGVTVTLAVAVVLLNAVLPPTAAAVTTVPAAPLVWSQARKVMDALPA